MGLLGRAKSMMQGWSSTAPTRPQSFSVSCGQGHRLQGRRNEGYQALRCPTCGEGIFVLPRSPLPEPPTPASTSRSRVASIVETFPEDDQIALTDPVHSFGSHDGLDEPEVEIDWVDEAPADPEPSVKAKPPAAPAPRPDKPRPSPGNPTPTSSPKRQEPRLRDPDPALVEVERQTFREWASKNRNVLLVAAMVVLIFGTVAIRMRRQRLEEFPRIAELGLSEGLRKLDAGEFHAAKKIMADAAEAVQGLGGRFEGAELIRQGAVEASLFADLAPKGIDEILEEAATSESKDWPSRFATMYKGRSVILDPPISGVPDPARAGSTYQVNFPVYFGRGPKPEKGRIELTGFRLFELAQPKMDEQKPFGARYRSVELDVNSNEWVVTLEPNSGAFITHTKALEALDWAKPEPIEGAGP